MTKKDITPAQAHQELYIRFLNEEYITFLTEKIVRLQKKRLTYNNLKETDSNLYQEFEKTLIPSGRLARVRRKIKRI